jgi:hypothetical protein
MAIVTKVISGNSVKNGDVVVHGAKGLSASGMIDSNHVITPNVNSNGTGAITSLNNRYDAYFDTPRYYSGDAVG